MLKNTADVDTEQNSMAGTGDLILEEESEAVEIRPLILDKTYTEDDLMYDFRPQAVEADQPDANPKDLSVAAPADSLLSEIAPVNDSQLELDLTVPAVKVSTKSKG